MIWFEIWNPVIKKEPFLYGKCVIEFLLRYAQNNNTFLPFSSSAFPFMQTNIPIRPQLWCLLRESQLGPFVKFFGFISICCRFVSILVYCEHATSGKVGEKVTIYYDYKTTTFNPNLLSLVFVAIIIIIIFFFFFLLPFHKLWYNLSLSIIDFLNWLILRITTGPVWFFSLNWEIMSATWSASHHLYLWHFFYNF